MATTTPDETCAAVHFAVLSLARRDYRCERNVLPTNGIYLFFETGEDAVLDGKTIPRIVRVGTHRVDGRFPARIRQHYGQVNSLDGSKNGSVFRLHVGGALMARMDPTDPRLPEWRRHGGASSPEIEELVSRTLRESFTFVCFSVPAREERLTLERGLIALLAQHPLAPPSLGWLGRCATSRTIRETGLWNVQHADSEALTPDEFELFTRRVSGESA